MCGFVGIAGAGASRFRAEVIRGADSLYHRGPDSGGDWQAPDGGVVLAHRRLAIIDLSPGGDQPMTKCGGRFTVAFNGEIYNFRELRSELVERGHPFSSASDTEVLLSAWMEWGAAALDRLVGQFAFALYDGQERRLTLARDRVGEKPLFYRWDGRALRFSSELKGLLADPSLPRRINPDALDCYLAMGYVPGENCILDGFAKLPAGHTLQFRLDDGNVHVHRWWATPEWSDPGCSDGELLDELEARLETAVARQMVADVPVGVLLSGGIDSSLVTAMAARTSGRVTTFTVGFPGAGGGMTNQPTRD